MGYDEYDDLESNGDAFCIWISCPDEIDEDDDDDDDEEEEEEERISTFYMIDGLINETNINSDNNNNINSIG